MGGTHYGKACAQIGDPFGRDHRAARLFMSKVFCWQPSEMDNMDAFDFVEDFQLAQDLMKK